MTLCSATTTDRLSGCLAQCTLPKGHDGDHTDGGGMTWGFRAHDLDIDNSNSHISRLLRGKLPPPPTEEEIVERTRRALYREVLAKCGVDAAEDASATALLLQVDEVIDGLRSTPYDAKPSRAQQRIRQLKTELDELREAARAAVGVCVDKDDEDGLFCCDCGAKDLAESSAWRHLCALVKDR